MKENSRETTMTLGEKLKTARKNAGLTQEQLAKQLIVSRQAVTKWESDRGMPDIDNLKKLSKLLNVSIDYLLNDEESLYLTVTREKIDLDSYSYNRKINGRWVKKTGKKDMIVREKFPDAEIRCLVGKQISTNAEKVIDNALGFLTDAPFGIPQFINAVKNTDKEFYLVNQSDKQFFIIVTDKFIECRQMTEKITEKKFVIGDFSFIDCGLIPEPNVE